MTHDEFFSARPASISPLDWITDDGNPNALPKIAWKIVDIIFRNSRMRGFTIFRQTTIAEWLNVTADWFRRVIRKLIEIGVVIYRQIGSRKQYAILKNFGQINPADKPAPTINPKPADNPGQVSAQIIEESTGNNGDLQATIDQPINTINHEEHAIIGSDYHSERNPSKSSDPVQNRPQRATSAYQRGLKREDLNANQAGNYKGTMKGCGLCCEGIIPYRDASGEWQGKQCNCEYGKYYL